MNLLTIQASLVAVILGIATTIAVLIRQRQGLSLRYAYFAMSVSAFYFASFLRSLMHKVDFDPIHIGIAAAVVVTGNAFFQQLLSDHGQRASRRGRLAWLAALALLMIALTPLHSYIPMRVMAALLALLPLAVLIFITEKRARSVDSRVDRWRLRYITVGGLLVLIVVSIDLIGTLGMPWPRTSGIAVGVYLYIISQTLERKRLLDLHELLAKAAIFSVLGLILAAVYGLLVLWAPGPAVSIFNTMLASALILILFDPLRSWLENFFARTFFARQRDFSLVLQQLSPKILSQNDPEQAGELVLSDIYNSGRVTHCNLYILDESENNLVLSGFRGERPEARLEPAMIRALLNNFAKTSTALSLETLQDEQRSLENDLNRANTDSSRDPHQAGHLQALIQALQAMQADLVFPVVSHTQIIALLSLRDERASLSLNGDELRQIRKVLDLLSIALENTRVLEGMRERERLVLLGELATGLVHKIRAPLRKIEQDLSANKEDNTPEKDADNPALSHHQNKEISSKIKELDILLDKFLVYAQPVGHTFAPFDLSTLARHSLDLFTPRCPKQVKIEVNLPQNMPMVSGDVIQIQQVIDHLLHNALQAVGAEGEIFLHCEHRSSSMSVDPGELVLTVRDDGPGIDPEARQRLFEPFFSSWEGRPGLGLTICQRIAEAHGGRIGLRSKAGEGAEFSLHLPLIAQQKQDSAQARKS